MLRSKKTNYILLAVLIALVLATLGALGVLEPVKGAFLGVGGGTVRVVRWPFVKAYDFFATIGEIGKLRSNNKGLKREIESLKVENAKLKEDLQELDDLRRQFNFAEAFNAETLSGRVIGKTSDEARQIIIINRGLSSGVEENNAVLSPEGALIGVVKKVFINTSEVALLTDPSSIINVKIQGIDNGIGVLKGEHGVSLVMESIEKTANAEKGQAVVTSGLGGILPHGLVAGQISEVFSVESDLFKAAKVEPITSYRTLENIFVLKEIYEE